MIRGLVVGKFAPLHRGHKFLIDTALSRSDELLILSYTSRQFEGCSASRRRRWLETAFPNARIVVLDEDETIPEDDSSDEIQRAFVARKLLELNYLPTQVFTSEDYGPGFADHLSRHLNYPVTHISVDQSRSKLPISATQIRKSVHGNRQWLPGHVYSDFVEKIGILGAESTGKSTLGLWLAQQLETNYVAEYGRELWVRRQGNLLYEDMLLIAETQIQGELELSATANRYLVCDTTPLTTLFYCLEYFDKADKKLVELAARPYEHVVLLTPDFSLVQDGTRQDEAFRSAQQKWYVSELEKRKLTHITIAGHLQYRKDLLQQIFPSADQEI